MARRGSGSWAVRRALESGYHRATGRALPTARDRDVPFRRILVWAAVSAAAVAVANVVVDRVVLRPTLPLTAGSTRDSEQPAASSRSHRLRTGRFEAFSDGVFAIAITLLVLDIAVPIGAADHLLSAVADQWPVYLAYFISFSTIGAIWLAHSAITDYLEHTDPILSRLNLLLLLFVSFLPFPTRLLAEYTGEELGERVAVTLYGVNLLLAAVLVSVLWRYSVREGLVRPDADDEEVQTLSQPPDPKPGWLRRPDRHRAVPPDRRNRRLPRHRHLPDRAVRADQRTQDQRDGRDRIMTDLAPRVAAKTGWGVAGMLAAAQFIMVLDTTVMNVSISQVVADLNTTIVGLQTAITMYTLVMASFMLIGGKFGERWGAKRAFWVGLLVYGTGSFLTSVAPNLAVLLIGWSLHRGPGRDPGHPGHRGADRRDLPGQAAGDRLRDPRRRQRGVDGGRPPHRWLGVRLPLLAIRVRRRVGRGPDHPALPADHPGGASAQDQARHRRRRPVRARPGLHRAGHPALQPVGLDHARARASRRSTANR